MSKPKYHEGQVVKIKSYEELKANVYNLLYSDERLKQIAGAEVAIYRVVNDQRVIAWYQAGQWGHNIMEIPEAYIECDVSTCQAAPSEAASPTCRPNFLEFANQVRAGVSNGEYTYRDLKELLDECLAVLDSKSVKVAKQNKVKEDITELLSGIWKSMPTNFARNRVHYFEPGMLVFDVKAKLSKDESIEIDKIHMREFLRVPEIYFGKVSRDKAIKEAIRKHSVKEEKEDPRTFEQVIAMIERKLTLFSTRWYSHKLRSEGLTPCLDEIKSLFDSVKRDITHHGENGEYYINSHLLELAMFAIQTVIYLEKPNETDSEKRIEAFYDVTLRMITLYQNDTKLFGNFFSNWLDEDGLLVAKIRIRDRVNDYCLLVENRGKNGAEDSLMVEVLIEMACFCVMTIMWLDL